MHQQETNIALGHPGNHVLNLCLRGVDMNVANADQQLLRNGLEARNSMVTSQSIVMEGKLKQQKEETLMWISRFALTRLRQVWGS
jgi:hypothetical protein